MEFLEQNLNSDTEKNGQWYAVHTRSRSEAKVFSQFRSKSISSFLPRMQVRSRRKDRKKTLLVPMFPGYVFVRSNLDPDAHLDIVKTVGVVRLIGINGRPEPVRSDEIANLMILDGTDKIVANGYGFKIADRVEVMDGPFSGLKGRVKRRAGKADRIVVSLDLLGRFVEVELDDWNLEKTTSC